MMEKQRCPWGSIDADPVMREYHDQEWGVPVHDDRKHFEFLVLEGAQAGLSWSTILHRRAGYAKAFDGFDPERIARFTEVRVRRLLQDAGIIRNRLKIESAVRNAGAFRKIQEEFGAFDDYVWRFVGGEPRTNRWRRQGQVPPRSEESDVLSKDLKARGFSFVGSTIVYAHLQAVGMVNDHLVGCYRHLELARR